MTSGEGEYLLCQVLLVRPCLLCSLVRVALTLGKGVSGWIESRAPLPHSVSMSPDVLLLLGASSWSPPSKAQKLVSCLFCLLYWESSSIRPALGGGALQCEAQPASFSPLSSSPLLVLDFFSGFVAAFYTKGQAGMVCWPGLTGILLVHKIKNIFAFEFCRCDCSAFLMWVSFLSLASIFSGFINFTRIGKFSAVSA